MQVKVGHMSIHIPCRQLKGWAARLNSIPEKHDIDECPEQVLFHTTAVFDPYHKRAARLENPIHFAEHSLPVFNVFDNGL